MKNKIIAELKDNGFGFPIILEHVPMVEVRGKLTPYVNYNNLAKYVLNSLIELNGRLSGNQIKFIRQHFEMTLEAFGDRFTVSHPAVIKWERAKDKPTGMSWSTEKDIRLFAKKKLLGNAKAFLDLYIQLEGGVSKKTPLIKLNIQKLAA